MPKRKRDGDCAAEPRKKQLYLIFDDWSCGYTIREVDLQSCRSHPSAVSGELAAQRLPPPVLRLPAPHGLPGFFAHAFGTSIIATHPERSLSGGSGEDAIQIFDVRKRSIIYGPSLGFPLCPTFFPVGDSHLFALHSNCLELLRRRHRGRRPRKWPWRSLPGPPFSAREVASYTVHPDPDGPSIIITTQDLLGAVATFTFHTENLVWKKRGEWALPFTGCAHFDSDLGIFVGLSNDPKTPGHLCSFDKASLINTCNTDEWHAPACNLGPQNLFSDNPGEKHESATLIYLGGESKYCLVECIFFKDVRADQVVKEGDEDDQVVKEGDEVGYRRSCFMYRLTKFSLRYGRKRDLKAKSRRVQYYKVPKRHWLSPSDVFLWHFGCKMSIMSC